MAGCVTKFSRACAMYKSHQSDLKATTGSSRERRYGRINPEKNSPTPELRNTHSTATNVWTEAGRASRLAGLWDQEPHWRCRDSPARYIV